MVVEQQMTELQPSPALNSARSLLESILAGFHSELADDFRAYEHHCKRVLLLAFKLLPAAESDSLTLEKLSVASAFHDLGIWTAHTFDYLAPSCRLASNYLEQHGREAWGTEIEAMINFHHKITRVNGFPLAEIFRRADWCDVTLGMRRFALGRAEVRAIRRTYPNAGFHRRLCQFTWERWRRYPLDPLPMMRW